MYDYVKFLTCWLQVFLWNIKKPVSSCEEENVSTNLHCGLQWICAQLGYCFKCCEENYKKENLYDKF